MKNEFIPYDIALALKELGFDEMCFGMYIEDESWQPAAYSYEGYNFPKNSEFPYIMSPLYQQAFRWFRDEYNISYAIYKSTKNGWKYSIWEGKTYLTYQEAQDACLKKLIEIVKSESH